MTHNSTITEYGEVDRFFNRDVIDQLHSIDIPFELKLANDIASLSCEKDLFTNEIYYLFKDLKKIVWANNFKNRFVFEITDTHYKLFGLSKLPEYTGDKTKQSLINLIRKKAQGETNGRSI